MAALCTVPLCPFHKAINIYPSSLASCFQKLHFTSVFFSVRWDHKLCSFSLTALPPWKENAPYVGVIYNRQAPAGTARVGPGRPASAGPSRPGRLSFPMQAAVFLPSNSQKISDALIPPTQTQC